jgi:hypothetical protein
MDMRILDLLRGERLPGSALLRDALVQAEAERGEATAALDRLTARRAELLLDGTERALDQAERDIVQATRRVDRLDLVIVQAEQRLKEAEAAERAAELDAAFAKGEALADEAVGLIRRVYPPLARKVLELAGRLEAIDGEVAELNRRLAEAGDPRRVRDHDAEARPGAPADGPGLPRRRFWMQLELPSSEDHGRLLWPATTSYGRPLRAEEGVPPR